MPDFKDLTDVLFYLQTVRKSPSPDFPRFALSFSSKSQDYFLINQLLRFSLFPEKFSHKLASIELVVRNSFDPLKNPTLEIDGINESFQSLEEFKSRFFQHILSLPLQNYTETVTVLISMASTPSFNLLILPDLESGQCDQLEHENAKKKIVKKALRDLNNLVICVSDIEDDLDASRPIEYLRQYDPYGLRTLLVFIDSETNIMQDASKNIALQKVLTEQEFPIKYDFLVLRKLPLMNQENPQVINDYKTGQINEFLTKERELLYFAMKEMAICSVRGVFPGLLDELRDIQREFQTRLDWLNEDGTQRGYHIKIEGVKPVLDIGLQLRKEFQDEAYTTNTYVTKEKQVIKPKVSTIEPEVNKAISRIKGENDSDYVRSYDSLESVENKSLTDDIVFVESVPFGFRITEIFASLYRSDANKDDIARFKILADDEIKIVFQTSQSRTVYDFIKSQGFRALVISRLNWIIGHTCESVWNIHETVSSTLVKMVEKYFIKFPVLRDSLKQELKGFTQVAREATVQALMPVLNSHVNYIYCKDPSRVFGDLYEVPSGKRKNSFKPETSLVVLIQQLSEACKLYCQSVVDSLRDCIPRMIGQLYLSEILQNIGKRIETCIESLAPENSEAFISIDPYQAERDVLEQKLMMIEKAKRFILHEPSLKEVVWIEGLNLEKIRPEVAEKPSEGDISAASTGENTDRSKMNKKQLITDDLQAKRLKSDTIESQSVDEEFRNEEEYEAIKEIFLDLDLKKNGSPLKLPMDKPSSRKGSQQEESKGQDDIQKEESEGNEDQKSNKDMPIGSQNNISSRPNQEQTNYFSFSENIYFGGLEVIQDYWSRLQKYQDKVLTQKEWAYELQSRSIVDIDPGRLLASVYYGINKDIRGGVWKFIAKVKELRSKHPKGFYEELSNTPSKWDYTIQKDVVRTIVEEPFFKNSEYQGDVKLKRVLRAYALYDPDLGYTQGMNALAGIILMVMCGYKSNTNPAKYNRVSKSCESNAFWTLVYIMKERGYRDSFLDSYPKLMENLKSFEEVMKQKAPWVLEHLEKCEVSVQSAFMHQFLTAGGQHAPLELFLRIMDIFLVKGEAVLFELILKALDLCKKEILAAKDEKLFKFLKHDILYLTLKKCGGDVNKLFNYAAES